MPGWVDLSNRRALVTGAARGIGKAVALALAEAVAHALSHPTLWQRRKAARIDR